MTLTQDQIAALIAHPKGEDPVISLYVHAWGPAAERKALVKNLVKHGEEAIEGDTGWDAERKKQGKAQLERAHKKVEELLSGAPTQGQGSHAVFAFPGDLTTISVPVDIRPRVIVDRTPYASPLSSLLDQYERYGVIVCDQKKAKLFEVYLQQVEGWEELEDAVERHRSAPAGGPARKAGGPAGRTGGYQGLEELRRKNHAEYVLHQHLQHVADRAFARFKLRPFDRLILAGSKEVLGKLEEHLHDYLQRRVVAREPLAVDLSPKQAREKILPIEAKVEEQKERELLADINDRLGGSGLAASGVDESLRCLFFGKVRTLVVLDDHPETPGRECPECRFLFPRPEDVGEKSPTLVECPVCKRSTRRVPDVTDEAVELAIASGARVEHVAYAKDELNKLGGMAAVLRFK